MALKDLAGVDIGVIGQGMKKYLTISLGKYIIFNDSYHFLGSTLATVAKNLEKTGLECLFNHGKRFHTVEEPEMRMLVCMAVYPY